LLEVFISPNVPVFFRYAEQVHLFEGVDLIETAEVSVFAEMIYDLTKVLAVSHSLDALMQTLYLEMSKLTQRVNLLSLEAGYIFLQGTVVKVVVVDEHMEEGLRAFN
jgi:hypothetical protein